MLGARYSILKELFSLWLSVGQDHHQILLSSRPLHVQYSAVPEETRRYYKNLEKSKKYYAPDFKSFGETSTTWEKWEC